MKKKIVSIALVAALAITAVVGTTLAYFTDHDEAENVMTLGNVDIEQYETDKAGENFVQDQDLFPMVDLRKEGEAVVGEDGFFNEKMNNVIDKVVTVENTGDYDAYVRTILAFETARHYAEGSDTEYTDMHDVYIGTLGDFEYLEGEDAYVTVNGVEYKLAVCVYEEALAPEEVSAPSLKQFFLAPTADNETKEIFGNDGEYTILAVSQAVQAAGFEEVGAEVALNTAFGDLSDRDAEMEAKLISWLEAAIPAE